jgi:hypothetical protein
MGKQVASLKVNEEFKSVLPNSIRKFTMSWKNVDNQADWSELKKEWHNFALGKHKATLVLTYGSGNQIITDEREFVIWPWRLMTVFSIGLVVAVALFVLLMNTYNKMVIKQYQKKLMKDEKPPEPKKE